MNIVAGNKLVKKAQPPDFLIIHIGLSLLEVSVSILLVTIVFIITMNYYTKKTTNEVVQLASKQITSELDGIRNYVNLNGDRGLNFNNNCIAQISNDQLDNEILNVISSKTILNEDSTFYIKKKKCQDPVTNKGAYDVLLLLKDKKSTEGRISSSSLLDLMQSVGFVSGFYNVSDNCLDGQKNSWSVNLSDWGIEPEHYQAGFYESFIRKSEKHFGAASLSSIELHEFYDGILSSQNIFKITSDNDRIEVIWQGAKIQLTKIVISLTNKKNYIKKITAETLNGSYGGDYYFNPYNLLPINAAGNYTLTVNISVAGKNGVMSDDETRTIDILVK
ncbi:hypothetical protein SAMN05216516_102283 [Izhakiella capsodis]|uniref:Uncharacterized protein n=1 Tax=Izhakiella capsodis TaxID=1367852 RepID=A0A1I4W4F6_9GAMM|nr:hypothetical protein [Izhakiella capsodis]SFN08411.1 hypothetical protein SAMN05216516_102283 [Izhakiella capsodis]